MIDINSSVVAAAAHAYCKARMEKNPTDKLLVDTHDALYAAHRATTPPPTPPTHVIVEKAEIERARNVARLWVAYSTTGLDDDQLFWSALDKLALGTDVTP